MQPVGGSELDKCESELPKFARRGAYREWPRYWLPIRSALACTDCRLNRRHDEWSVKKRHNSGPQIRIVAATTAPLCEGVQINGARRSPGRKTNTCTNGSTWELPFIVCTVFNLQRIAQRNPQCRVGFLAHKPDRISRRLQKRAFMRFDRAVDRRNSHVCSRGDGLCREGCVGHCG